MSSPVFPEETIHEILSYVLYIPCEEFFKHNRNRAIGHRERIRSLGEAAPVPITSVLLVSKAWLRIGTRLLYESLKLDNSHQTEAVAELFRTNEVVGSMVRHLRLEGGYGKILFELIAHTPNVESLYLYPDAPVRQSVSGICETLLALNPKYVKIDKRREIPNRNSRSIRQILRLSIIKIWTNLRQAAFDVADPLHEELILALRDSKSLEHIILSEEVAHDWIKRGWIPVLAESSSLKFFVCHGRLGIAERIWQLVPNAGFTEHIEEMFYFVQKEPDTHATMLEEHQEGGVSVQPMYMSYKGEIIEV